MRRIQQSRGLSLETTEVEGLAGEVRGPKGYSGPFELGTRWAAGREVKNKVSPVVPRSRRRAPSL